MGKSKKETYVTSSSESSSDSEDNSALKSRQPQPLGNTANRLLRLQQNAEHTMSESDSSDSSSDQSHEFPKIEKSSAKNSSQVADRKAVLKAKQKSSSSSDSSDSASESEDKKTNIKAEIGTKTETTFTRILANASEDWESVSDFGLESKLEGIITSLESPVRPDSPVALQTPVFASKLLRNEVNPFSSTPSIARFSPLTTPLATAASSSSTSDTSESGEMSEDDENVTLKSGKELKDGDAETEMCSSPAKKCVGKQLFMREKPFNFDCPDGFQEMEVKNSPVWQEDVVGKELWLIKAPLDFEASLLNGLKPSKMPALIGKAETKGEIDFKWKTKTIAGKDIRVNDYSMVLPSKASRQPSYAGEFSGEIHISKCYPAPSYVIPASTKVPPQIPPGLKLRHVPFGSGICVDIKDYEGRSADSTLLSNSSRKHKKNKRNREEADNVDSIDSFIKDDGNIPMVIESDMNVSLREPKKKKKKKEKTKEQVDNVVSMEKIEDTVHTVTKNTLDESTKNEGKKKKKKEKHKNVDTEDVAAEILQDTSTNSLHETTDHENRSLSDNVLKKKSKKKKHKSGV